MTSQEDQERYEHDITVSRIKQAESDMNEEQQDQKQAKKEDLDNKQS